MGDGQRATPAPDGDTLRRLVLDLAWSCDDFEAVAEACEWLGATDLSAAAEELYGGRNETR